MNRSRKILCEVMGLLVVSPAGLIQLQLDNTKYSISSDYRRLFVPTNSPTVLMLRTFVSG